MRLSQSSALKIAKRFPFLVTNCTDCSASSPLIETPPRLLTDSELLTIVQTGKAKGGRSEWHFRPLFPFPESVGRSRRRHAQRFAAPVTWRSRLRRQRRGVPDRHRAVVRSAGAVGGREALPNREARKERPACIIRGEVLVGPIVPQSAKETGSWPPCL